METADSVVRENPAMFLQQVNLHFIVKRRFDLGWRTSSARKFVLCGNRLSQIRATRENSP
jgi:hypothetical protein